jgi:hypothetical protein
LDFYFTIMDVLDLVGGVYNPKVKRNYSEGYQRSKWIERLSEDVSTLQREGFLYHATPLHNLEGVLQKGMLIGESSKQDEMGKYLCLTEDLSSAISFAHHVHLMFSSRPQIVGVVGINSSNLPSKVKSKLAPDTLFTRGIITRKNIAPQYFNELILADLEANAEELVELTKDFQRRYGLETTPIDYDLGTRRFEYRK